MRVWFRQYFHDNDGSVATDWIVLTGLAISLTLSVIAVVSAGAENGSRDMVAPATISTNF
ncbi:MAG: hypothetical protein KDA67_09380 [Rhodobacteraceae bacterium]|nr:hypothetical protein [Paracoccaceae bacterium]